MYRRSCYAYSFFSGPVDSLITNSLINLDLYCFEQSMVGYALGQYLLTRALTKNSSKLGLLGAGYMYCNSLRAIVYWNSKHSEDFLANYDPTFLTPLAVGCFNYVLVKTSGWKELDTIKQDQNKLKLVNICFMTSLAVVGLPMDILLNYLMMSGCQIGLQLVKKYQIWRLLKKGQINI